MIKNNQNSVVSNILRIVEPKVSFPELVLEKGSSLGIYSDNVCGVTKNLFKILCEPKKYAEKVTINELVASNSAWLGRAFTHVVIPSFWKKSILEILKLTPSKKHLIVIAAEKKEIFKEDLSEISSIVSNLKKDGALITITDSCELLEAVSDSVLNEEGNELFIETGEFFVDFNTNEEITDLSQLSSNVKDIRVKKIKFKIKEESFSDFFN
jgi:hypothetical protein